MPLQRERSGAQYRCTVSEAVYMSSVKGRCFAEVSKNIQRAFIKISKAFMTQAITHSVKVTGPRV